MPESFSIPKKNRIHLAFQHGRLKPTSANDPAFSTPQDVIELFTRHLPDSGKKSISFYFHGGLVPSEDELSHWKAISENPEMKPLFDELNAHSYPVFVIWETGPLETLRSIAAEFAEKPFEYLYNILEKAAGGMIFKKLTGHVASYLSRKLGLPLGLGLDEGSPALPVAPLPVNAPLAGAFEPEQSAYPELTEADREAFMAQLEADEELNTRLAEIAARASGAALGLDESETVEERMEATDYLAPEMMRALVADVQAAPPTGLGLDAGISGLLQFNNVYLKMAEVLFHVGQRFVNGRHHDFIPTVFEEAAVVLNLQPLVLLLWQQMKDNAEEAYHANLRNDPEPFGGRFIIHQLKRYLLAHPDTQVNLIGHSAGSLHISHFVETAHQVIGRALPEFRFQNIILMAPGADFVTFGKVVRHRKRFANLRIFTMLEDFEKEDKMVGLLYPHSILYFVSGVADRDPSGDRPILGLARHLDAAHFARLNIQDDSVTAVHRLLQQLELQTGESPVIWTATDLTQPTGRRSRADRHGNFDNEAVTLESIGTYL